MSRSRDLLVTEVAHPRRAARVLARGERETENLVQACLAIQEKRKMATAHQYAAAGSKNEILCWGVPGTGATQDSQAWDALLHGGETSVWADKGYVGAAREALLSGPARSGASRNRMPTLRDTLFQIAGRFRSSGCRPR